jgi:hypothetical protein
VKRISPVLLMNENRVRGYRLGLTWTPHVFAIDSSTIYTCPDVQR